MKVLKDKKPLIPIKKPLFKEKPQKKKGKNIFQTFFP